MGIRFDEVTRSSIPTRSKGERSIHRLETARNQRVGLGFKPFRASVIMVAALVIASAVTTWTSTTLADAPPEADTPGSTNERIVAEEPILSVDIEPAFAGRSFDRPVLVTYADDGTKRLFVVEQKGRVLAFEDHKSTADPQVVLDIRPRVRYSDRQNEEGLLGLAFHPQFKTNGQLFIYYSKQIEPPERPAMSVISRFHIDKNDSNRVDLESEEVVLTVEQPYWNHNGGTIVFGPDRCLYIGLGDGGKANDPHDNGQNLGALLGTILRIDVDRKESGRTYAIPSDNPFVDTPGARPEIFAYGLRNVWRMAFDRKTGVLWAGDVGQNLWEEIDIIRSGGNYGWNRREARHPFGEPPLEPTNAGPFVEPVWEYHHDVGKSITGGLVYRGKKVPELVGKYLYADYVGGQIWALDYDIATGKVRANYRIPAENHPIMSFGEDTEGEVYFTTSFGKIYRFGHDD